MRRGTEVQTTNVSKYTRRKTRVLEFFFTLNEENCNKEQINKTKRF